MTLITTDWVRMMARYNTWQNQAMGHAMATLSLDDLTRDRGAFFGSILSTANHLVWGDTMWMSRFDGGARPAQSGQDALTAYPTAAAWNAERFKIDGRINNWAAGLSQLDLTGNMTWYSGGLGRDATAATGMLITHFFNHQTHHRGQIHAMLTAAGAKTEDTDLFLMPE